MTIGELCRTCMARIVTLVTRLGRTCDSDNAHRYWGLSHVSHLSHLICGGSASHVTFPNPSVT